jgi:exopolysaccharide biosynthesis polyprenyl glycosylphosphotransferase
MNVHALGNTRTVRGQARLRWRASHAALRTRFYLLLIAADLACIFCSMFVASKIYTPPSATFDWLLVSSLLAPVYLGVAASARAYTSDVIVKPAVGIARAVRSLVIALFLILLVAFFLKASGELSRLQTALGATVTLVTLTLVRWQVLRRAHALTGGNPFCVALISDGAAPRIDLTQFSFIIHAAGDLNPDEDCPLMFDRLATMLRDVDRVVIACPPERRLSWVRMLKGANIRGELIAPELTAVAPLDLGRCGDMPTIVIAEGPLDTRDSGFKRAFDILISLGALVALSPLMLVVAILIKLSSPGPVFFVQTRIGQGNRMFSMFKFRSMRVEQQDKSGGRSAGRQDDRVTPIGRIIRKTSIDELPQLLNVLRGEMSIVGPRPHALGSRVGDKLFWEVDNRYWHRHAVKPGLTGLAQVRGYRGATEQTSDLTNRLHADLEYLHDWSLGRDMLIMIQTLRVVVHRNAF